MTRADQRAAFAATHGWGAAAIAPLSQDASARSYWRLAGGPRPAVLMDAPGAQADIARHVAIGAHLHDAGLSVPHVFAVDAAAGLLAAEDFGDALLSHLHANDVALYDAATDALAALARVPPPPTLPRWNAAAMACATAATFLDWWWPAVFGAAAEASVRAGFDAAMAAMLAPLDHHPTGLVHRDYFAGNLFWLPDRAGARRIGIIDFQDAAIGSPAYDLVSLVQDARRDLPARLAERQVARYLAARPELDAADFAAACAICAAQRHLRVAALWVRLDRRDGKPGYMLHGPRCWAMLAAALAHPATAPLAAFLDRHVPPALRGNPGPGPAPGPAA